MLLWAVVVERLSDPGRLLFFAVRLATDRRQQHTVSPGLGECTGCSFTAHT